MKHSRGSDVSGPTDLDGDAMARAKEWAQTSADNDGRRWLVAHLGADVDACSAAGILADLGPAGSSTTRPDREAAVRVLVLHVAGLSAEVERLQAERDLSRKARVIRRAADENISRHQAALAFGWPYLYPDETS